jgi:hypothetical protein
MLTDEITVFDIKYNEGMERLNALLSEEPNINSIKNYVERYKLDRSRENRISQKNSTNANGNIYKEDKRKQIVDIYEIRDHEKKVQQFFNKNYLKNEIEWFKIKKREDEHKNKYNYNKTKFDNISYNNYQSDTNKDIIRTNNIKMKKFSNLANKVNIDKFIQLKKLNQNQKQNSISEKNNNNTNYSRKNKNNINDGVFIPYEEFLKNELNNKNKNKINIKKIDNFNPRKTETPQSNGIGGVNKINKNSKNYNIINTNNNANVKNIPIKQNKSYKMQSKTIIKSRTNNLNNTPNNNNNKQKIKIDGDGNINNNIKNNKVHYIYNNVKRFNMSQSNIINNRNNKNSQSLSANRNGNIVSHSQDNSNNKDNKGNRNTAPINNDIRYRIEIRKPLDKKIDYLRERKTSPDQKIKIYDSKQIKDKKNILNNIEILNFHSKKYEDEAKRQELLMRVKGNKKYGNEDNVKLSNLLIDSISTKLAILNQITHDK